VHAHGVRGCGWGCLTSPLLCRGDWPQIDPNDDKDSFLDSDLETGSDVGSLGHNGRERGRGEQHLPVAMRAPGGTTRGDLDLPALEAENSQTWKSFVDRSFMECGICLAGDSQRDNPSTFVNLLWCGGLGESEAEVRGRWPTPRGALCGAPAQCPRAVTQ